jgi:hypothetical protein
MCNGKRQKFFEEGKHVMEHTHNIYVNDTNIPNVQIQMFKAII